MAKNSAKKSAAAEFSPPGDENEKVVMSEAKFEIFDTMPPPPVTKRGFPKKEDKFPWDDLKVGGGFYIAATAEKPEPWKSMASTVSAAQRRYSEVVGTKTSKKTGKVMDVRKYSRKFKIYPVVIEGVTWAAVTRVE